MRASSESKVETSQPIKPSSRIEERGHNVKGKNNIVEGFKTTEPVLKQRGAWTNRELFRPSPLFSMTTSPASGTIMDLSSIDREQVDL